MTNTLVMDSEALTESGVFSGITSVYERHGFDAGYSTALRDQLSALHAAAEEFLAEIRDVEARRLILRFVGRVQERVPANSDRHFVEDGLGI